MGETSAIVPFHLFPSIKVSAKLASSISDPDHESRIKDMQARKRQNRIITALSSISEALDPKSKPDRSSDIRQELIGIIIQLPPILELHYLLRRVQQLPDEPDVSIQG